ncbi:MAG: 2OG-Fe(II) oxygenase [Lysobacterales bacterium]|nr:MAG: 2OG-Fe(II) oxygenase [Xanthomonadales bacterium]
MPAFLSEAEAEAALAALLAEVPFSQPSVRLFGKLRPSPRLACWMGEATYRYSGVSYAPLPWTPTVLALRRRIEQALRASFNGVLINLYRDGRDSMGWHADDEPELGAEPLIASLSLGAARIFAIRRRPRGPILRIPLPPGSLLVMSGASQRDFLHALPPTAKPAAARINLTFRRILGPSAPDRRAPAQGAA